MPQTLIYVTISLVVKALKINYQKELEKVLAECKDSPKRLLLHVCCAPCSSYVLEYLSNYFEITVFYYNPNIEPKSEFDFRQNEERRLISELKTKYPVHFIAGEYNPEDFHAAIKGVENTGEGGERCRRCFNLRLSKTAQLCKSENFDYFTTTLSISPLKNAETLNDIGLAAAKEYGVCWLYSDFKKKGGYLRSIELSKQYNLYRQNYCGCAYSKNERYLPQDK